MAARTVLTDVHWLREIARFQSGLPGLIHSFSREKLTPRSELVAAAVAAQDLDVLAMLDRLADEPQYARDIRFDHALESAAQLGRRNALQWLLARHRKRGLSESPLELLDAVVGGCGNVELAKWIVVQCPESSQHISLDSLAHAASSGHLAIMQWLQETSRGDAAFQPTTMDRAAASGQMEIATFLHDHRQEGCTVQAPIQAAANGHLLMLSLLFQWYPHHFTSTPAILDAATGATAPSDRLAVVQYLHETAHARCTTSAIDNAASSGDTAVVAYLLTRRTEGFSSNALTSAARAGHVDVVRLFLEYLYSHPELLATLTTTVYTRALTAASQSGHMDIVELVLDAASRAMSSKPNVVPAIRVAAAWGHLEIVKLLLAKGEWISLLDAITQALYQGHREIVELLQRATLERLAEAPKKRIA